MSERPDDVAAWRARAEAAERTVTVLKHRVKLLQDGGQTALQRTLERARLREVEARRRQELLAVRNGELQRHGERLAAEVAARTRDLQIIFDNVVTGFLVVDAEARIRPGFTRSCRELMPGQPDAGVPLCDALGLEPRAAGDLRVAIGQVFDDVLPEEVSLAMVARRVPGRAGGRVRLDARVIRAGELVEGLLITLTDVTNLEHAERENEHFRLLVSLLRQRDAFRAFLTDLRAQLDEATTLVDLDQAALRRIVHTIKGNAATFGLTEVARVAHHLEDRPAIDGVALDRLDGAVRTFLHDNRDVLGVALDAAEARTEEAHGALRALVAGTAHAAAIDAWIASRELRPATTLVAALPSLVQRVAERLGKQVELVIEGGELPVDPRRLGPVVRELGHLVRNAIDHGIEPPDERGGKPPIGQVTIRFDRDDGVDRITVSDDGRGMDSDALAARAAALGVSATAHSQSQRLALALLDGVSTAAEVTDLSGRGVGLAAVRAAVGRSGGRVRLSSRPGLGTSIELRVPG